MKKTLKEYKMQEESAAVQPTYSTDLSRFNVLVRAGLAEKKHLTSLHVILGKMSAGENLSRTERNLVTILFNKMLDLITNNDSIYQKVKQSVKENYDEHGLIESANENKKLPPILILKRKAIRLFPNGVKVATYFSDKLQRMFTLPMNDLDTSSVQD